MMRERSGEACTSGSVTRAAREEGSADGDHEPAGGAGQGRAASRSAASRRASVILSQATATGQLLFLDEGVVDVALEDIFIARVAEPGAVFGDISFLLDQPHTADGERGAALELPSGRGAGGVPRGRARRSRSTSPRSWRGRLNAVNHLLVEARRRVDETEQQDVLADTLDRIGHALQTHGAR